MPGPRPTPTRIKELRGTARMKPSEPRPRKGKPSCPTYLSKYAKTEWRRIAAELHRLGLLTVVDRAALAAYCEAYGRWRTAVELTSAPDFEPVLTSGKGGQYINPILNIESAARRDMVRLAAEFGMTPAAREKVSVEPPDDTPSIAETLFQIASESRKARGN